MREDPAVRTDTDMFDDRADDNVVTLPNLMSGRLADLLAAASSAGQAHELRGELSARTAFQAASATWPSPRRKLRRTPAVLAVTTVATMMVATTGLAAATELPGSAGRAVQGIFGTVGVNLGSPTPSSGGTGGGAPSGSGTFASDSNLSVGAAHGACTVGGADTSAVNGVRAGSCTINIPRQGSPAVTTTPRATAPRSPSLASRPAGPSVTRQPKGGAHSGGGTTVVQGSGGTGGGGSNRGGNDGGGGCGTTTTTTTTTTTPPTGSSSDSTTTTTDPSSAASGCGNSGGHHRGSGSDTTTTTTTLP